MRNCAIRSRAGRSVGLIASIGKLFVWIVGFCVASR